VPARADDASVIRVAVEYGLGYAPLYLVAKKPEFIQKYIPGAQISIQHLAGGPAVRDALVAGTVDIGGIGVAPVIQAADKGVDLKIAVGMAFVPTELITYRDDIKSVRDLEPADKVNVVSSGSLQAMEMKMAGDAYFNNPSALDGNMATISHPAAVAAVQKHVMTGEFATPPFIRALLREPGMHAILSNRDFAAASCMPILAAASGHFHDRTKEYDAVVHAVQDAIVWINANPKAAAEFFAADQGGTMSAAEWLAELQQPGVKFSPVPKGEAALAAFMQKIGIVSKAASYDDLTWPNLHGVGGS
ncbi:MAG: ABC transporter substrate-binding protein, partial [Vulcanimicrobiaceae bacterium]